MLSAAEIATTASAPSIGSTKPQPEMHQQHGRRLADHRDPADEHQHAQADRDIGARRLRRPRHLAVIRHPLSALPAGAVAPRAPRHYSGSAVPDAAKRPAARKSGSRPSCPALCHERAFRHYAPRVPLRHRGLGADQALRHDAGGRRHRLHRAGAARRSACSAATAPARPPPSRCCSACCSRPPGASACSARTCARDRLPGPAADEFFLALCRPAASPDGAPRTCASTASCTASPRVGERIERAGARPAISTTSSDRPDRQALRRARRPAWRWPRR